MEEYTQKEAAQVSESNQELAAMVAARRKKRIAQEQAETALPEEVPMADFVSILMKKGLITSEDLATEERRMLRAVR